MREREREREREKKKVQSVSLIEVFTSCFQVSCFFFGLVHLLFKIKGERERERKRIHSVYLFVLLFTICLF